MAKRHLLISLSWQGRLGSLCVGGLTSSCLCARSEHERAEMCQQGETSKQRGRDEHRQKNRKRKREGGIFIPQYHSDLSCRLGVCMFCWYSNGPDRTRDEKLSDGSSEDRQTGMSSLPQQLWLFLLLVFPDLINRLLCLCTHTVSLHVQSLVLEINHYSFLGFDLLCLHSWESLLIACVASMASTVVFSLQKKIFLFLFLFFLEHFFSFYLH